jgi:hypothetical protein
LSFIEGTGSYVVCVFWVRTRARWGEEAVTGHMLYSYCVTDKLTIYHCSKNVPRYRGVVDGPLCNRNILGSPAATQIREVCRREDKSSPILILSRIIGLVLFARSLRLGVGRLHTETVLEMGEYHLRITRERLLPKRKLWSLSVQR